MSNLNQWIVENQALVISIGLPLFTVLMGFFGSYLVHKGKADEVRLTGRVKLAEFRKENFDELKSLVSELQTLLGEQLLKRVSAEQTAEPIEISEHRETIQIGQEIMARIRSSDDLVEDFTVALGAALSFLRGEEELSKDQPLVKLRDVCHRVISSEWKQIENELKSLA